MSASSPTEMATPISDGQIRERLVGFGKRERNEVEELFDQGTQFGDRYVGCEPSLDVTPNLGGALESAAAPVAEGLDRHCWRLELGR